MGSLQILNGFRGRCALALCAAVAFVLAACGGGGGGGGGSSVVCPSTAASTVGLTLLDSLCGSLSGAKWSSPLTNLGVSGGAMVASSQISNAESNTVDGVVYQTLVSVVHGSQRVSTLKADINVPQSAVSRTGTAEVRAVLRLLYQPPNDRLFLSSANNLNSIVLEVGLRDAGNGLEALRNTRHCDTLNCTTRTQTGMTITDPGGFTAGGINTIVAPAAYDTTYTVTVSLNETTGILAWTIAGGTFGGGVSGTVDPAAYLAGNATWAALGANPLATSGFFNAQAGTRVFDLSVAGGGDGSITAGFKNVQVGFNNGAATAFDDFSGVGGNSGPTELSSAKWAQGPNVASSFSTLSSGGGLSGHVQATNSATALVQNFQGLTFNNPSTINTIQADVNMATCSNTAAFVAGQKFNRFDVRGIFYNDGTAGNAPSSALGDVRAILILDCQLNTAFFIIQRGTSATAFTTISSASNGVPIGSGAPVAGNTHTLKLSWDTTAHTFTFQVDGGTAITVDPKTVNVRMTTAAPFSAGPNSPQRQILWSVSMPLSATPATATTDVTLSNVYTAP